MTRVLLASHSPDLGGAENVLLHMAQATAGAADLDVRLLVPRAGELSSRLLAEGASLFALPNAWWTTPGHWHADWRGAISQLSDWLRAQEIDIVVSNSLVSPCAAIAAARAGVRHIWYAHESLHRRLITSVAPTTSAAHAYRLVDRLSDLVLFNSEAMQRWFDAFGNARLSRREVLPPALAAARHARLAALPEPVTAGRRLRVVSVGAISFRKGVQTFLDVARRVCQARTDVEFVMVGAASDAALYFDHSVANSPWRDRIRRETYRADIDTVLAEADIVYQPALIEPYGLAVLEGMLAGRAVVATRSGGPEELIENGTSGYLCAVDDSVEQAARLLDLLAHPARREALGRAARQRAAPLAAPERFDAAWCAALRRTAAAAPPDRAARAAAAAEAEALLAAVEGRLAATATPLPASPVQVATEIAELGGIAADEVVAHLSQELQQVGARVTADCRRFGVTPHRHDAAMDRLYAEGDGFIYELMASTLTPGRQLMGQYVLDALLQEADDLGRSAGEIALLLFGDGIGIEAIAAARHGFRPHYYDVPGSRTSAFAHRRFARYGVAEAIRPVGALDQVADDSLDALVCLEVLEHVEGPFALLAALVAKLRPGGLLVLSEAFESVEPAFPTHLASNLRYSGLTPYLACALGLECFAANSLPLAKPMLLRRSTEPPAALIARVAARPQTRQIDQAYGRGRLE